MNAEYIILIFSLDSANININVDKKLIDSMLFFIVIFFTIF